jgi:hypothetical protein
VKYAEVWLPASKKACARLLGYGIQRDCQVFPLSGRRSSVYPALLLYWYMFTVASVGVLLQWLDIAVNVCFLFLIS